MENKVRLSVFPDLEECQKWKTSMCVSVCIYLCLCDSKEVLGIRDYERFPNKLRHESNETSKNEK